MKKVLINIITICLSLGILVGCSSSEAEPLSLAGNWQGENEDGAYMAAYIVDDVIEVYWISEDDDSSFSNALYWSGSYDAPEEDVDTYEWDSINNTDKTSTALLASDAETKTFTYEDGTISFEVTAIGVTQTYEMTESDQDFSDLYSE